MHGRLVDYGNIEMAVALHALAIIDAGIAEQLAFLESCWPRLHATATSNAAAVQQGDVCEIILAGFRGDFCAEALQQYNLPELLSNFVSILRAVQWMDGLLSTHWVKYRRERPPSLRSVPFSEQAQRFIHAWHESGPHAPSWQPARRAELLACLFQIMCR